MKVPRQGSGSRRFCPWSAGSRQGELLKPPASAHARSIAFATPDVNAEEAPFLGTEHILRADHFHNQPCPTDPPGGPPGATSSPPLYEWSHLLERFGWDYWICHHFDSPW